MKFYEPDIVRAIRDINDKVKKGDEGTVVMVFYKDYSNPVEHVGYEVEFVDSDGNTLDFTEVTEEDIELIQRYYFDDTSE